MDIGLHLKACLETIINSFHEIFLDLIIFEINQIVTDINARASASFSHTLGQYNLMQSIQKASETLDPHHLSALHERLTSNKSIPELFELLIESLLEQINDLKSRTSKTSSG